MLWPAVILVAPVVADDDETGRVSHAAAGFDVGGKDRSSREETWCCSLARLEKEENLVTSANSGDKQRHWRGLGSRPVVFDGGGAVIGLVGWRLGLSECVTEKRPWVSHSANS